MPKEQQGGETNDRLVAAATEVFADVGYRAATLREICRRGNANIAAVNYHFRDKEQLYRVVLEQAVLAAGEGLMHITPDEDCHPRGNCGTLSSIFSAACWAPIGPCNCCG